MRIILSFDTEDFTDPVSNDVLGRICRALTERDVVATFGLVGQKARFIRDEGRDDVIDALKRHAIGYHSDNHFAFPDENHPQRYVWRIVEQCGWDEAVDWLIKTEKRGLDDIEEIFGTRPTTMLRTCGDAVAQVLWAYRKLGLITYGYGLGGSERRDHQLYRFADMVCTAPPKVNDDTVLKGKGPAWLKSMADQGGDLVTLCSHPCCYLAVDGQWWSMANFLDSSEDHPPRTGPPWNTVPHLPAEETDRRIQYLCETVDYARKELGATFTTHDEIAAELPPDPDVLTGRQVLDCARQMRQRVSCATADGVVFSLAEQFGALVEALAQGQPDRVSRRTLLGPEHLCRATGYAGQSVSAGDLREAARAVMNQLAATDRVPDAVALANRTVPPAAFGRAVAEVLTGAESVVLRPAPDFPEGFDDHYAYWDNLNGDLLHSSGSPGRPTPNTLRTLKLQYWTYKPLKPQTARMT